jgi:hypothetical protein
MAELISPPMYSAPTQVWREYLSGLKKSLAATKGEEADPLLLAAISGAERQLALHKERGWDKYPTIPANKQPRADTKTTS